MVHGDDSERQRLIVACYTSGDYAEVAEEMLLPSLRDLGLAHDVREVPNLGSWVANGFGCQLFLMRMHWKMPEVDFLFLDVDATVQSDPWPYLSRLDCDIAGYYFKGKELLTGTLYLPAGPRRKELLTRWIEKNQAAPDIWDQKHLQALLEEDPTFKVSHLPAEYCCIFDLQRKQTPGIVPVIEHHQASRRLKNRVSRIYDTVNFGDLKGE